MEEKKDWKYWLNEWESHLSAICFIVIGIMLTVQVISRYVFKHSFTAFEEIATALYVLMTYSGVSAAVTHRKHLTISALPDALPYKARKVLLIVDNVIFMAFCIYVIPYFVKYIRSIGNSVLPVSRIPEKYFYWFIPIFLGVTVIRIVQDASVLPRKMKRTSARASRASTSTPLSVLRRPRKRRTPLLPRRKRRRKEKANNGNDRTDCSYLHSACHGR